MSKKYLGKIIKGRTRPLGKNMQGSLKKKHKHHMLVGFRAVLYQFGDAPQVYVPVHHKLQVILICSHRASSCITGAITSSTLFGRFITCTELSCQHLQFCCPCTIKRNGLRFCKNMHRCGYADSVEMRAPENLGILILKREKNQPMLVSSTYILETVSPCMKRE
jgi:hypothetical protein